MQQISGILNIGAVHLLPLCQMRKAREIVNTNSIVFKELNVF